MGIIKIDRTNPFSSKDIFGTDVWEIEKTSCQIEEIDLSQINYLNSHMYNLDVYIFKMIWLNKQLIPEEWKTRIPFSYPDSDIAAFPFWGTLFRRKGTFYGFRLVIYYSKWREWEYDFCCIDVL